MAKTTGDENRMNTIKFSQHYQKLTHPLFPAIRRHGKWLQDEIVTVQSPQETFTAKIVYACELQLQDIPTELLCYDTDTRTREEALTVLNPFFHTPLGEEENVTLYLLLKKEV